MIRAGKAAGGLASAVVAIAVFSTSHEVRAAPVREGDAETGKIIAWGDVPPPTYVMDHIEEMEKVPFDGMVLGLPPDAGARNFSWKVWGPKVLRVEDYSRSIEALKATRFKRFTDNFLTLNVVAPEYVDWFDDEFKSVVANARLLAHIGKTCGMKGIVLDVEQYPQFAGTPFMYQDGR